MAEIQAHPCSGECHCQKFWRHHLAAADRIIFHTGSATGGTYLLLWEWSHRAPYPAHVVPGPESPRWYMKKGRMTDAWRSMKQLRKNELQAARDLVRRHAQFLSKLTFDSVLRSCTDRGYHERTSDILTGTIVTRYRSSETCHCGDGMPTSSPSLESGTLPLQLALFTLARIYAESTVRRLPCVDSADILSYR